MVKNWRLLCCYLGKFQPKSTRVEHRQNYKSWDNNGKDDLGTHLTIVGSPSRTSWMWYREDWVSSIWTLNIFPSMAVIFSPTSSIPSAVCTRKLATPWENIAPSKITWYRSCRSSSRFWLQRSINWGIGEVKLVPADVYSWTVVVHVMVGSLGTCCQYY